jgi:hypothetical protein
MFVQKFKNKYYLPFLFNHKLWLVGMLMFSFLAVKSQTTVNDSINESVYFDLRKQYELDTSTVFTSDNAPSPDMVGKRKYVKPVFKICKSMPLISIKNEESIEFKNETYETIE